MDLKEVISVAQQVLSKNGQRLDKIERAVELAKNRMSFYKGAAIVGWALASLLGLILLVALRRQSGFNQRQ